MKDPHPHSFREKVYILLFTNNTKAGYNFDIILTWMIVVSVATVILETVGNLSINYRRVFNFAEWVFTILFTIEYIFRLYSAKNRWKYAISFFGLVDLLAILPCLPIYCRLLTYPPHFHAPRPYVHAVHLSFHVPCF